MTRPHNKSSHKPTLLVADDEADIADIIQAVGEDLGFEVTCVLEGLEVVALVDRLNPDVICLDLRMPGADGVEIIRELGNRHCASNIILMSGMDQRTLSSVQTLGREHALEIGSTLTKPMSIDAIEAALRPFAGGRKHTADIPKFTKASSFDYGLTIYYEPELVLKPQNESNVPRIRVVPRWRNDDGEYLEESRFHDWIVKTGVVKGIARLMLDSALETLRVWGNQSFSPQLSLRLHAGWLKELDMPDVLAEIVDSFCVPRELVAIEVDEDAVTHEHNSIVDVLSRLRIKGFKISICIAREGEDILSQLDHLPVDTLVIDMSYLSNRPDFLHNMETEFLYSSMTSIINHKGIVTCASNVNSGEILTFLRRCDINSVRGSHIHAPVTSDSILPLYKAGSFENVQQQTSS